MGKLVLASATTRARWATAVAEWSDSGESQRAFCAKRGLPLSTFQWWRRRLKQAETESAGLSFLPIPMHGSAGDAAVAVVEIGLRSGTRLRFVGEAALRAVEHLVSRVR
jgi:hypothetical protein